jgi:hypothetical protein
MGLQQQQQQQMDAVRQQSVPVGSPVASVLDAPEVHIQHSGLFNYWLVTIKCRDRNKLFFDTVCEWLRAGGLLLYPCSAAAGQCSRRPVKASL